MVDKLVKLAGKKGTATIEGVRYTADELLAIFVKQVLAIPGERLGIKNISAVVFTFQKKDSGLMDTVIRATDELEIPRERVHMANHAESYLFYVISQKKELWINQSCLFDLSENGLHYYELNVIRGRKPQIVEVGHEELEEGFSLEILETGAGRKLGDTILTSCGERLLQRKIVTSVFLTGKGFEETEWASGFLRLICNKRRVFAGPGLFARAPPTWPTIPSRSRPPTLTSACARDVSLPQSACRSAIRDGTGSWCWLRRGATGTRRKPRPPLFLTIRTCWSFW